jgi:hypothetical protein
MASTQGIKMTFRMTTVGLSALATAALVACGGGGSSSQVPPQTPAPTPTKVSFAGTVIDGYITGATVCLDLNANQTCDTGEPTDTSKADGTYSLDITSVTTAQLKAAHLITNVPTTAKDADDAGKTLAEAGKAAFQLMAPASAFVSADGKTLSSAVISPLTTLVSHDMQTDATKTLAQASATISSRLGLPVGTDLNQDFVKGKDANLKELAQVIAATIGEVQKLVIAADNTLSGQNALLAALSYVQQNAAALQIAAKSAASGTALQRTQAALQTAALSPVTSTLISDAKIVSSSSAVNVADVLAAGAYEVGECLFNPSNCTPEDYYKISGTASTWASAKFILGGSAWGVPTSSGSQDYQLTAKGWVADGSSYGSSSGTFTSDGLGGGTGSNSYGGTFRFTSTEVDLAGKTAGSVPGLTVPVSLASSTFPAGSKLYWMKTLNDADEYRIWTGNTIDVWNCMAGVAGGAAGACTQTTLTSVAGMISAFPTRNGSYQHMQWNDVRFSFDTGGTASGGNVTLWSQDSVGSLNQAGSAPYEIKTVFGQEVLIIKTPTKRVGEFVMFAVKDGVLRGGTFSSSSTYVTGRPWFNQTAMNAILNALGKPAVLN